MVKLIDGSVKFQRILNLVSLTTLKGIIVSTDSLVLTLPPARIVLGNLYKPNEKDAEGRPLVIKNGPNAGQPRVDFFFAVAVPKTPGAQHWGQEAWGAKIWQFGHTAAPNVAQSPAFAWKIEDGDSQIPNKRGRKNFQQEGMPGHWIVKLSGGYAPKIYQEQTPNNFVQMTQVDAVKPGYWVEVNITAKSNGSQSQPGIFLNHNMVCLRGYAPEINFGPDVASAGFGAAPLPAGVSMTPTASAAPMPMGAPMPGPGGMPGMPAPGGMQMPAPGAMAMAPAPMPGPGGMPGAIPGMAVAPVQGFAAGPGGPQMAPAPQPMGAMPGFTAPGAVPPSPGFPQAGSMTYPSNAAPMPGMQMPAPVPQAPQMTAKAAGYSYEQLVAGGWTPERLRAEGYMM